jgi:hypothetical protein
MSNYFELTNKVLTALKLETVATFGSLTDTIHLSVMQALNTINDEVVNMDSERWLFREKVTVTPIVANQYSYDLPSGIVDSIQIEGVSKQLFFEYDWKELENIEGTPDRFYVTGGKYYLWPHPTADFTGRDITVYYRIDKPATDALGVAKEEMTLATDVSIIPVKFHNVLLFGACWDVKGRPEQGRYQHFSTRYKNWINIMKQEYSTVAANKPYISYKPKADESLVKDFFARWK